MPVHIPERSSTEKAVRKVELSDAEQTAHRCVGKDVRPCKTRVQSRSFQFTIDESVDEPTPQDAVDKKDKRCRVTRRQSLYEQDMA